MDFPPLPHSSDVDSIERLGRLRGPLLFDITEHVQFHKRLPTNLVSLVSCLSWTLLPLVPPCTAYPPGAPTRISSCSTASLSGYLVPQLWRTPACFPIIFIKSVRVARCGQSLSRILILFSVRLGTYTCNLSMAMCSL